MGALVTNNAVGTLASGINDSTTTIVLSSGQGALFPSPGADDFFFITVVDTSNNKEIMKVTDRSVNTLTVVRAQDNTTAKSFLAADRVELRFCAALHAEYAQLHGDNTFTGDQDITGDVTVDGEVGADSSSIDAMQGKSLEMYGDAGTIREFLKVRSGANKRFRMYLTDVAEDGSNNGSDMVGETYAADGTTLLATFMKVNRKNGFMQILRGSTLGASDKIDAFPAGTKLLFPQAAAPTGWVQDTDVNDRVIRVVSSAGGGTGGSWTISGVSALGHALTAAELADHKHQFGAQGDHRSAGGGGDDLWVGQTDSSGSWDHKSRTTGIVDVTPGQAHTHEIASDGSWRPSRLDVIKCTKS